MTHGVAREMSNTAISVEEVWKSFRLYHERNQYLKTTLLRGGRTKHDEFWALKGTSFEVPSGSTFGIIGSNGSGKSTLLKCLAGILTPDKGNIRVNGRLAALLELGAGFHPDLTGRENINLNAAILGMTRKDIEKHFEDIVDFSGLERFIDTPVKNYSSGMVVRLGFAVAINVDPEILLIDEVLAVGDESFQQRCYEKIEDLRRDGRTIVLVSHGLSQITQLCTTTAWIEKGDLRRVGPSYEVVSEYSGVSHHAQPKRAEELGERWGSQEAEILNVNFLDFNGAERVPETGKDLILRIAYKTNAPIDGMVIGIRITDLHGNTVWGTNTKRRAVAFGRVSGLGFAEYRVNELPLLAGTYDLTVALSDHSEVNAYDHWDKRIRFNVVQHMTFDEGIAYVDGTWLIGN